jgi:hypothetical protein
VAGDDFGFVVAIKNDTIFVCCPSDYVDGNKTGSVFKFVCTGTTRVQSDRLTAGDAGDTQQKKKELIDAFCCALNLHKSLISIKI